MQLVWQQVVQYIVALICQFFGSQLSAGVKRSPAGGVFHDSVFQFKKLFTSHYIGSNRTSRYECPYSFLTVLLLLIKTPQHRYKRQQIFFNSISAHVSLTLLKKGTVIYNCNKFCVRNFLFMTLPTTIKQFQMLSCIPL